MTRKLLVLSSVLAALAFIAACSGDGGKKKAKIDAFTANPSIVPSLGGEVTLTWQVRNADEVEIAPDVGVVSGTSLTLSVTETTEFTLIAKRNGTSRRRAATVTVTAPDMVVGTVRSMIDAVAVPDAVVIIKGHDPVITDVNGMFAVPSVATPYQLRLVSPEQGITVVYDGLTRFDPLIDYPISQVVAGLDRSQQIDGTVTGTLAGTATLVSVDTDVVMSEFFGFDTADDTTGAYSSTYNWRNGPTSVPATVHALRAGDATPITSYLYASAETTLTDGAPAQTVNLTLSSAGIATTEFFYNNAEQFSFQDAIGAILLETTPTGTALDRGFALPSHSVVPGTSGHVTLTTPDMQDALAVFTLSYQDGFGIGFDIQTVPVGTPSVESALRTPTRALLPVTEAAITSESTFAIAGQPDSVKLFLFALSGPTTHTVMLVTTENAVRLPDLKDIGVDYDLMDEVEWFALEIAPRTNLDEVAGPGGILGANPRFIGGSMNRVAFLPGIYDEN